MNTNFKNICEIVEVRKENLTDSQYKTIMDNIMVLNERKEETDENLEDVFRQITF
jgi:hypothetical protein